MDAKRLERTFYFAALLIVVALACFVFGPYLGMLVLAATLAFIFRPTFDWLSKITGMPSFAALLVVLFVVAIVFLPLGVFALKVFSEASNLYGSLSSNGGFNLGANITNVLHATFPTLAIPDIHLNFNDSARAALNWLIQNLGSLFSSFAQALFIAFLSLMGLFYFLKDGAAFKRWTLALLPLSPEYAEGIIRETEAVMTSVVRGTLFVALIQGLVVGCGFLIFGIPNPAVWGALTVVASLIPLVGTWLVVVPAIAYLFFAHSTGLAIGFAIWSVVLVNLVYNILSPQLMRRGIDIHPFVILLSVLGGLTVFGPIGFLVGPFIIALLFSLLGIYPRLIKEKNARARNHNAA